MNNVAVDLTTNMVYAQQYEGKGFYRYNPRTNKWTTLAKAPIKQGNNGGAAYVKGKIYTVYTENDTKMGVYDVATGTWSTITNPLGGGHREISPLIWAFCTWSTGTDFISYDPATDTTQTLASPPFGFEAWGGLAPYKGEIYGQQGNGDDNRGFAQYDIASDTWTEDDDLPSGAVLGAAIDPVTGIFYAYGSYGNDPSKYCFNTVKTKEWLFTLTVPLSQPQRWRHGVRVGEGPAGYLCHLRTGEHWFHPLCDAAPLSGPPAPAGGRRSPGADRRGQIRYPKVKSYALTPGGTFSVSA